MNAVNAQICFLSLIHSVEWIFKLGASPQISYVYDCECWRLSIAGHQIVTPNYFKVTSTMWHLSVQLYW